MELKPCPFCGGEAHLHTWRDEPTRRNLAVIKCKECGVKTPLYYRIYLAEQAWNRRVEPNMVEIDQFSRAGEGEKE